MAQTAKLPRRAMQRRNIPRPGVGTGTHSAPIPQNDAQNRISQLDAAHEVNSFPTAIQYNMLSRKRGHGDNSDLDRLPVKRRAVEAIATVVSQKPVLGFDETGTSEAIDHDSDDSSDDFDPGPSRPVRRTKGGLHEVSCASIDTNSHETSEDDTDSDSDVESILDSGYGSAEDNPAQETAFYNVFIVERDAEGPTMAVHDENTTKMTFAEEEKWKRFCQMMKYDPDETLEECKASIFKAYLHWRLKHSRIKKESSIMTYWNVLCMVYAVKTARWMDGGILYDIGNFIHAALTPLFGLDTSKKEKSGLFVEDLDLILHYHYVRDTSIYAHERLRVQLSLILIIAGATSNRPDAIIGSVLYEHIEFQLFPPSPGERRPRLGLVVDLVHIKKTAGSSKPITFGFHEEDTLLHDPVLHMLALAFADGAFLNEFSSPEQIYELEVPPEADRLRIPWKEEWQRRPIFRDIDDDLKMSLEKAWKYAQARGHLIGLGRALGYAKKLEFYDIRRGSGKRLNEKLGPEERNQAMGHRLGDSSTYVRYYMTDFVGADTQAIVFGSDPQTDFTKLMSRLVRHGKAPTSLTDQQKDEVFNDPILVKYREKRSKALARLKEMGHKSVADAKRAGVGKPYEKYQKYQKRIASLSKTLSAKRLESAIAEFHQTVHGKEIDQQLNGMKPSKEVLAPSTINYELEERAVVAELFAQAPHFGNQEELFQLRIRLVSALVRLCKRRESPRHAKGSRFGDMSRKNAQPESSVQLGSKVSAGVSMDAKSSEAPVSRLVGTICPFCRWRDSEVGEGQRQKKWRMDSLAKHIRSQHLERIQVPFRCPYNDCQAILGTDEHFANHSARAHGDHYPSSIVSR